MERFLVLTTVFLHAILVNFPTEAIVAKHCDPRACLLPSCRCSNTEIPGGVHVRDAPQFVILTFDDAVTQINSEFYKQAFDNRTNPDGCPVSATYFVSHEYTDYTKVHELYRKGHEIALHSITHQVGTDYWKHASVERLTNEFHEERTLISTFANLPKDTMNGLRLPFLQLPGNNLFEMMKQHNLAYDFSWPTQDFLQPGLWPYSLEYQSTQDCMIGVCPTNSFKDVWIFPMLSLHDDLGNICSMVDACAAMPKTHEGVFNLLVRNFIRSYISNKAPFGLNMHSAWFSADPVRFSAYRRFLDYVQTLPDVFITSPTNVLKWVKKPVPYTQMTNPSWCNCRKPARFDCRFTSCHMKKDKEDRYMNICGDHCPKNYPWYGNPRGL